MSHDEQHNRGDEQREHMRGVMAKVAKMLTETYIVERSACDKGMTFTRAELQDIVLRAYQTGLVSALERLHEDVCGRLQSVMPDGDHL
jgi:hypothetical protein